MDNIRCFITAIKSLIDVNDYGLVNAAKNELKDMTLDRVYNVIR